MNEDRKYRLRSISLLIDCGKLKERYGTALLLAEAMGLDVSELGRNTLYARLKDRGLEWSKQYGLWVLRDDEIFQFLWGMSHGARFEWEKDKDGNLVLEITSYWGIVVPFKSWIKDKRNASRISR
jgi:hypothetical protein